MTAGRKRPLERALTADLDQVDVHATGTYLIAGVYSFGRGVLARGPIAGSETSYKKLNRLHAGQLLVSRLKAFEGALAVVPPERNGWFVSPEFPTFRCVDGELDPAYLAHICRWPEFWSMLAANSRGIGARRERVHAEDILSIELALPSIDDQRIVAERLDLLQAAATELASRSAHAAQLTAALAVSTSARPDLEDRAKSEAGWRRVALGEVMSPASARVTVEPDGSYPNVGIYSFGRGMFTKPDIDGSTTSAKVLNRVRSGQFIYSRLFAFEGAYTYVPPEFDGCFVSNEFPAFDADRDQLDARWLANYLRSPDRWSELGGSSKGLGVRRQRVPVEAVQAYEVWLPPIQHQRSAVATIERIDRTRIRRAQSQQRLDSLMPAALNEAFATVS